MSYDVSLSISTGNNNYVNAADFNYTSNIGGILSKALDNHHISSLNNVEARELQPILKRALDYMLEHSQELRLYEPSNGWGTYEGACKFIADIYQACLDHPDCIVSVSC